MLQGILETFIGLGFSIGPVIGGKILPIKNKRSHLYLFIFIRRTLYFGRLSTAFLRLGKCNDPDDTVQFVDIAGL